MILRRKPKAAPETVVAYLDWVDPEQTELRWHAGILAPTAITPRSGQVSIGYQMEAIKNTLPHIRDLSYVRTGNVVNVMHKHVSRLATSALLDRTHLTATADRYGMGDPVVIIAPNSLLTLADEDDARRLAAELTIAYALVSLKDCSFDWVGE